MSNPKPHEVTVAVRSPRSHKGVSSEKVRDKTLLFDLIGVVEVESGISPASVVDALREKAADLGGDYIFNLNLKTLEGGIYGYGDAYRIFSVEVPGNEVGLSREAYLKSRKNE